MFGSTLYHPLIFCPLHSTLLCSALCWVRAPGRELQREGCTCAAFGGFPCARCIPFTLPMLISADRLWCQGRLRQLAPPAFAPCCGRPQSPPPSPVAGRACMHGPLLMTPRAPASRAYAACAAQWGRTALRTASKWGYVAVVRELLAAGADVNKADDVSAPPCLLLRGLCAVSCGVHTWPCIAPCSPWSLSPSIHTRKLSPALVLHGVG